MLNNGNFSFKELDQEEEDRYVIGGKDSCQVSQILDELAWSVRPRKAGSFLKTFERSCGFSKQAIFAILPIST